MQIPDGPPRLPPSRIGMASSLQLLVTDVMPKPRPEPPNSIPFTMVEVLRPDLTTIAIHPYEPTVNEASINEIRNHYLDDRFDQWQVSVSFSKTMSAICLSR